jgi:preprotein translocase subunit SecA
MGRAIVTLIDVELLRVFGDSSGDDSPAFMQRAEDELAARETRVAAREGRVEAAEKRLHRWSEHLRLLEAELKAREQRTELTSKLAALPRDAGPKVGRNERCPCRSGLKYKHCHGLPGRPGNPLPR